jgi:DNA-binding SARP family transcriptional activator/DNA-binding XRE family transcriptional regulator
MNGQRDAARARLSALVREYRRAAGLTQRQLARRSGLSIAAVRDLEQGRRYRPRSESVAALAGALGLDRRQTYALARAGDAESSAPAGDGSGLWLTALGPLAAWRDGRPLELGPPRQRVALGLLALQPGELVRRETVIDVLWGQQPPATAAVLVQAQVSRLRRVLDPGGRGGLLEQGRAGYRLRAGAEQLDVVAFTELAARAATSAAAGDAAAACGLYQASLRLWRGDPAADAEALRGHQVVADLLRRRADAVLGYAEAAFGLGQPERVIPLLDALAREQPLNERVHARLMVALAATGQQAVAIEVFEHLRRRLDEDLGVYPGRELAEAHQRVLRQDIRSAVGENAAVANYQDEMPGAGKTAPSAALVGRDDEMALLTWPSCSTGAWPT